MLNMDPGKWLQAGDGHFDMGRFEEAIHCYGNAVETEPGLAAAWNSMGAAFQEKGDPKRATICYEKAIEGDPGLAEAHYNLGLILQERGKWDDAVRCYRSVLQLNPDRPDALNNLGNILHEQGRFQQALSCFRRVIAVDPSYARAYNNLGKTLQEQGKIHEAIHWYEKAVALKAGYAQARFNLSIARLTAGDFPRGWEGLEWRFRTRDRKKIYPHAYGKPRWQGESFVGKRLFVHAEQGLGDTIQFVRYLPAVKVRGGTVVFETLEPLHSILQGFPGIDEISDFSQTRPAGVEFDCHVPLLSLPGIFGTHRDTIPADVPYLFATPEKIRQWSRRLSDDGFRVGIVWAGKPTHGNDRNRSVDLSRFAPLAGISGVHLYGLQKGPQGLQTSESGSRAIPNLGEFFEDFSDTAGVVARLDLVISVDTAVAHLAGAMGKPVWLLLPFVPDWRWMTDRIDSPWYPTMRLFRQERRGDWQSVFETVARELKRLASRTVTLRTEGSSPADPPVPPAAIPDGAESLFEAGNIYLGRGGIDAAIECFRQVLTLRPRSFEAAYNLGNALLAGNDPRQAVEAYEHALGCRPAFPEAWNNLGVAFERVENAAQAEICYRKALEWRPDYPEAFCNIARLYQDRNDPENALQWYEKALRANPEAPAVLNGLGQSLHALGDYAGEAAAYRRALSLKPDFPEARFNLSLVQLLTGQWADGFKGFEERFRLAHRHKFYPHRYNAPLWDGAPFPGKRLLVHSEQGLGDQLQFVRYLPMVKELGGTVLFETRRELAGLFKHLDGVDRLHIFSPETNPEGEFDLYIPLLSLPRIFETTPDRVPSPISYLHADPAMAAAWKQRLSGEGLRVGIVWAGTTTDPRRACPLPVFYPLADVPGIRFWGLQKGIAAEQARVEGWLSRLEMINLGDLLEDFSDTAAAIANLDLVISIDTSVAHLAGAMGKPVWLLLPFIPDWRWLLGRDDSPWYPTMRLFRQEKRGDWEGTLRRVAQELKRQDAGRQESMRQKAPDSPGLISIS